MSFSGRVHNMANGERREHQYRVDRKALYTHQLTQLYVHTVCHIECTIAHDWHIELLTVATHHLPVSQCGTCSG